MDDIVSAKQGSSIQNMSKQMINFSFIYVYSVKKNYLGNM
jgi:hypothetical protein